jgi:hypothetical protein
MPTIPYIDRVDLLGVVERQGVIRGLSRKARVLWPPGTVIPQDYTVLQQALTTAGVPVAFSRLLLGDNVSPVPGFQNLVLMERNSDIVEQDPGTVDVTLKYEHVLDGPNQVLFSPPRGVTFGKGKCSITQKPTNFYYPYGDRTQPRTQIQVGHQFDVKDQYIGGVTILKNLPNTIVQGGEINAPFPQINFSMEGVVTPATNPVDLAMNIITCINLNPWQGRPSFTWIVSEVSWEVLDALAGLYRYSFEFQFDPDTWNPTVIFNDQRTGAPPANAKPGSKNAIEFPAPPAPLPPILSYQANSITGALFPADYWTVPYLLPVDFNTAFNSFFEGDVPAGSIGGV